MTVARPKWSTGGLGIQEIQQIKVCGIPTNNGSAIAKTQGLRSALTPYRHPGRSEAESRGSVSRPLHRAEMVGVRRRLGGRGYGLPQSLEFPRLGS